jgi:hypothetical protein
MRAGDFALGLVLRAVLGRVQRKPGEGATPRLRRRRGGRSSASSPRTRPAAAPARRGPLMAATLGSFALGVPLMIIFEATLTRILGVLLLFAFITCGVFLIADPAFLEGEESQEG